MRRSAAEACRASLRARARQSRPGLHGVTARSPRLRGAAPMFHRCCPSHMDRLPGAAPLTHFHGGLDDQPPDRPDRGRAGGVPFTGGLCAPDPQTAAPPRIGPRGRRTAPGCARAPWHAYASPDGRSEVRTWLVTRRPAAQTSDPPGGAIARPTRAAAGEDGLIDVRTHPPGAMRGGRARAYVRASRHSAIFGGGFRDARSALPSNGRSRREVGERR